MNEQRTTINYSASKSLWLLLAVLFVWSLFGLGEWGAMDTSEGRYAHIAQNMYTSGDYVHPVYLGVEHYHKPPLTYQITALAYHIFGPGIFAARLMLQIAVLLQMLFVFLIGKLIFRNARDAGHAVLIYFSFAMIWIAGRTLTTDAYLTAWILGSAWCLIAYAKSAKIKWLYFLALFAALGFLTKITAYFVIIGPLALAIYFHDKSSWKWSWHILLAALLFILFSSTWFIALGDQGWDIFKYLMYEQSLVRYASDVFYRNQVWYFYLMLVPLLCLPWFVFAIWSVIKSKVHFLNRETTVYLLVWFIFPVLFYSLSKSKLILYVLPAFPALALFCADALRKIATPKWFNILTAAYCILLLTAGLVYQFVATEYASSTMIMVIAGLGIFCIAYIFYSKKYIDRAVWLPAIAMGFLLVLAGKFLHLNGAHTSTTKYITEWLATEGLDDRPIFVVDQLTPSLTLHCDQPVALIADTRDVVRRELQFEQDHDWQVHYYNLDEENDRARLKAQLATPGVLMKRRGELSERAQFLRQYFRHSKELGKWEILY